MVKTITETFEERNSVTVTRDAKGLFKYEIKYYFSDDQPREVVRLAQDMYRDLVAKFEAENEIG